MISIFMVLVVIYTPVINSFLAFAGVTLVDWSKVVISGLIFLLGHEGINCFKQKSQKYKYRRADNV